MSLSLSVEPNPPRQGPSVLSVLLTDGDGGTVEGAQVDVKAQMPRMAQMSSLRVRTLPAKDGSYEAPFNWTMAGDWLVSVTVTLAGGEMISGDFDLAVERLVSAGKGADHAPARIPNGTASIHITSPEDGAIFKSGEDVRIVVDYQNFEIGEHGNHWHVYINGRSSRMIMSKINDTVLRNLEPGKNELSTYLSVGTHEELEDGSSVTIIVEP